ncbi:MAG: ketopantoate reductase C-terminal domain-containing protein [Xenococcaceae cyanobacterium]
MANQFQFNASNRAYPTAIAKTNGRNICDLYIQERFDRVAQMKHYLTSMKLDYERQKPLEIEALFGNPLRHALEFGVNVPRLTMLYLQLKFFDRFIEATKN